MTLQCPWTNNGYCEAPPEYVVSVVAAGRPDPGSESSSIFTAPTNFLDSNRLRYSTQCRKSEGLTWRYLCSSQPPPRSQRTMDDALNAAADYVEHGMEMKRRQG
jgi:hypothetical protein